MAPPVFPGDGTKTFRAKMLNYTVWANLALMACCLVGCVVGGLPATVSGVVVAFAGVSLAVRHGMFKGHVRGASGVFLGAGFVVLTFAIARLGTIRVPAMGFYVALVMAAGCLFEFGGALVLMTLSSLAVAALIWAENAGLLPRPDYTVTVAQWISTTALIACVGGWTYAALRAMRVALGKAEREVVERLAAEQALRGSEAKFRAVVENSYEGILFCRADGTVLYRSPSWSRIDGYPNADRVERSVFEGVHADDEDSVRRAWAKLVTEPRTFFKAEYQVRRQDGSWCWVETSGQNFIGSADVQAVVLTSRDITERRSSENVLRLRAAALEAAANAIVITDRDGLVEWANPAFYQQSGWSSAEAKGKNLRELVKSGQQGAEFYRQMWASIVAGGVWHGEIVNRRRDGALRTEDMTITPVRDERGDVVRFIAIKQDITDQKIMQAHLLQAQRMEAVGVLASGIAHDLNNILAPIVMVTGLIKDKLPEESDRELAAIAQASALRGADTIRQLLTFSRAQDGVRSLIQPRYLLKEMVVLMRQTYPREIDLQAELPEELWTIQADPSQLHQVLLNLCVNARDAMPRGGRLVIGATNRVLAESDPRLPPNVRGGPYVELAVSDTGHGIPQEIRHRIFDPFFTTKPVGKGTGLGLSTVLGIVKNHGGFVVLESSSSAGSTFKVFLPATPDGAVPVAGPASEPEPAGEEGRTILVVDDERTIRDSMRAVLEAQHFRVLSAAQGESGLAIYHAQRAKIDLVVTDIMMPVMTGVEMIRQIRVADPKIKIIAMSGLNEETHGSELAEQGVTDLLLKPFDGPELLKRVRRRLRDV